VLSVPIFRSAVAACPEIPEHIRAGDFAPLLGWLREHLYRYGRRFPVRTMIERLTGGPLDATPYLDYLRGKLAEVYGISGSAR
jgi:carboxypeptidase Taq